MVPSGVTRWVPFVLIAAACGAASPRDSLNPIAPGANTEPNTSLTLVPVPGGTRTLRGLVTERSASGSSRPLVRAGVNAWVNTDRMSYSYWWWAMGAQYSGADGRYELSSLPENSMVIPGASKEGYAQPCAAPPMRMSADVEVDIELVPRTLVITSPESVINSPGFRSISGVIYEATSGGRRPVVDAFVDYEPYMDVPAATTYSDSNGRYLLCGIPMDEKASIAASAGSGRFVYTEVPAGQTTADLLIPLDSVAYSYLSASIGSR